VRTPTRYETSGNVDARVFSPGVAHPSLPVVVRLFGNPDLCSEDLNAFELGWRWQPNAQFNLSLSSFAYDYAELQFITTETPYLQTTPVTAIIQPSRFDNGLWGECYGGEIVAQWQPRERLRLRLAYSLARTQLHTTLPDPFEYEHDEVTTPRNTVSLQVFHSLGAAWDLDTSVRYIDTVPFYHIPAYLSLDLRLAWHPTPAFEAALMGRDLFAPSHAEYRPAVVGQAVRIPRSGEVRLTWRY
jgi:iron complex outermembrane receptor protein